LELIKQYCINHGIPCIAESEKTFEYIISYYEKEELEPLHYYCLTKEEMEELKYEFETTGSMTLGEPWGDPGHKRIVMPEGIFISELKKVLINRPWHTHFHFESEVLGTWT
jgi:hypothetical protein